MHSEVSWRNEGRDIKDSFKEDMVEMNRGSNPHLMLRFCGGVLASFMVIRWLFYDKLRTVCIKAREFGVENWGEWPSLMAVDTGQEANLANSDLSDRRVPANVGLSRFFCNPLCHPPPFPLVMLLRLDRVVATFRMLDLDSWHKMVQRS